MKKIVIGVVVVALVAVGALAIVKKNSAKAQASATTQAQTVAVRRGNLTVTVNGAGNVEAANSAALSFRTSGQVDTVQTVLGDQVQSGQVLVQLDTTDLENDVKSAEISLKSAEANYSAVKAGPSAETIAGAKLDLQTAKDTLDSAQAAYDRVSWRPDIGAMPQSSALQQATLAYERAQITYATQVKGPTDDDLAVAYAQVQQATMTLEQAKQKLEQAKLIAPMAGTITALTCQVGDYLVANTTAVNLTDLTSLQIKVPVAELDVAQVAVGQSVVVTVDALPNTSLTGKITYVAPVGTITQGVVTYSATVTLDKTDAAVRPGMTAAVTIVVSNREQVLLVPNRAVSTSNGRSTVTVMKDGQASPVQVTIGSRNESYTEITDGLQEGDLVVVNGSSVTSTQASGVRGLGIPGLGGGSGAIMRATGN